MTQHFTPEELEKLQAALSVMDNDLFQDAVDELKEHFPAMAAELRRLWEVEKEFIELEKTIVFLDGKESL